MKEQLKASLSEVTMSAEAHKMIITGCITTIGKASTGFPCGANDKLAVFTQESIDMCAKTFEGMPLNCTYPDGWYSDGTDLFTGHGYKNIGYIREVHAEDDKLMAEIVVWKDKFPDEAYMIVNGMGALGFSVEWYATKTHEDEEHLYMDEFEGCGCAILWQNCAAFSDTFIEKLAAARDKRSDVKMTEEEKKVFAKEISDAVMASVEARFESVEQAQNEIKASIEASKVDETTIGELKEAIESLKASTENVEAAVEKQEQELGEIRAAHEETAGTPVNPMTAGAADIPVPKAGQHVEVNPMGATERTKAEIDKINASAMSPIEKLAAITKIRSQKA